jgi:hypothetical protein
VTMHGATDDLLHPVLGRAWSRSVSDIFVCTCLDSVFSSLFSMDLVVAVVSVWLADEDG